MDSRFFGFPLSTPLPLNYYQDYPRKEYLQISLSAEFSTFESFADFPYNEAAKEVDFYEKKDICGIACFDNDALRLFQKCNREPDGQYGKHSRDYGRNA